MRHADLLARAVLVVAAVAAVLLSVPTVATTVLAAAAALAVAHGLVRRRARGAVDAFLVGSGGILVALVVLGIALDLVGLGLRRETWAVALGVLALLALAVDTRRAAPGPAASGLGRLRRRDLPWFLAAGAVVAVAISVSVHSVDRLDVAPVAMSVGPVRGTTVQVVLSAGRSAGPYEVRTETGDGNSVSYPLVSLKPHARVAVTVYLPEKGRYVISLNNPGEDAAVRSLTVDR